MNAVLFATEGAIRRALSPLDLTRSQEVWISGCTAGLVVSFIDTPFDLVKTQLQNTGVGRKSTKTDLNSEIINIQNDSKI